MSDAIEHGRSPHNTLPPPSSPAPSHRVIPYLISSDVFTRLQHVQVTLLPRILRKNVEKTISVPIFLQKHIFVALVLGDLQLTSLRHKHRGLIVESPARESGLD